jgi:SAM-dependent methyltransferase
VAPADAGAHGTPADEPSTSEASDGEAAREADRLRAAIRRRGPLEARLGANRGQAAIVRERDRVLDLGCGEGATLGRLIACGAVATGVGVDLLPERIERARAAWPAIDFRVADAGHLPFPDEAFDIVLAMTVLSSIPLPARPGIAAEIARVVRSGGVFAWYDLRLPSPANPDVRPFRAADVAMLFHGWEMQVRRLTVLPPVARRLGPAAGVLYPVLARLPFVLSHEAGVARRPRIP